MTGMEANKAEADLIKVLWLTSSYPRYPHDSASVFLGYFAQALANQQINLHVLAPDHCDVEPAFRQGNPISSHFRYFFPRRLQQLAYGSGILPNLRAKPRLILQVPFFMLAMLLAAIRRLIIDKPTLIHAHWIFPQGTIAVLLGKLFRVPVVVTAHGGDAFALRGGVLAWIKRWTIKNCNVWTSNTQATADAVGPDLPKPHIIAMGIDYRRFAAGNAKLQRSSEPEKLVLLFVGRLVEKKGVADLLAAVAGLPMPLRGRTELWIVGDGTERKRLEALAFEYGINDQVIFYGGLPNSQLPGYYAAADIFIAPSIVDAQGDTEGQGVILLEAMASGTAVISTRTGGIVEVIEHGKTGLLVNSNAPAEIRDAVEQLVADKELRVSLCVAGQRAAESYEWRKVALKFTNLYRRLEQIQRLSSKS